MLDLLLWILLPLCVGFGIRVQNPLQLRLINQSLNYIVYLILVLIGIELAQVDNLGQELGFILGVSCLFLCINAAFNVLMVMLIDWKFPLRLRVHEHSERPSLKHALMGSLKQIACVAVGFAMAKYAFADLTLPHKSISVALALLLWCIGMQLRSSGISVKSVFFNRRALVVAAMVLFSSVLASVCLSWILNIRLSQALAINSGWGWYSLSGIIMTDAYGAVWGSVALVNDLGREFLALAMIPILMMRTPTAAVALGGVTALDFTLPTIQKSGGVEMVPLAISFGFIMNVISPILMAFFAHAKF